MSKLYVLQYDGGGYCSPFSGEIFTNKDKALEYIKNNDMEGFRYISVHEYNDKIQGYQESTRMYYIDKSRYNGSWGHYWKGYEDKTFVSSETYHDIINKIKEQYE